MCKSPLARLEKYERYTNKQGGISYKCDFDSWANIERNLRYYKNKYRKVDMIPCGQCLECRLNKARDKANQMILEKKNYSEEQCWFITLTYNDEHLRTHVTQNLETGELIEGISLLKKDIQNFTKRLRRYFEYHYNNKGIRYVIAGEYGSETNRPHYHMIVFGLNLDQTKLKFYKHNEMGQTIWTHKELQNLWKDKEGNDIGFVTVGRVTWNSCCYVARYTLKKHYKKDAGIYGCQGKIPEFILQSTKPAIGRQYLIENKEELYITKTIPIYNEKTGELIGLPKSYMRYIEKTDPEEYHKMQLSKKLKAESSEKLKQTQTDLTPEERRKAKDELLKQKFKNFRKEI